MWMTEEGIPKKMLHTKMEGKQPRGSPWTRWIDQIRKEYRNEGKIVQNTRKLEVGEQR